MHSQIVDIIKKILGKGHHSLHEPYFCGNEWKYVKKTLDENYVSSIGSFVNKFEDQIKRFTKSKYAIPVVNGTEALHLSLVACGVSSNDEEKGQWFKDLIHTQYPFEPMIIVTPKYSLQSNNTNFY